MPTPAKLIEPLAPAAPIAASHAAALAPETSQGYRLDSVDTLRGLAALAVCWYHMTNGYESTSPVRRSGEFGWLGVEIFFVISGFILPHALMRGEYRALRHWKTFVWKRMVRLEPPYLVAVLLAFALWHLSARMPGFGGNQAPEILSAQVLLHFGYLNGIAGHEWLVPVFWTLAIELQFYLLIAIAFPLVASPSSGVRLVAAAVFAGAFLATDSPLFVPRYLGLFLMGIAAFQYRCRRIGPYALVATLAAATWSVTATHGVPAVIVSLGTALILTFDVSLGRHRVLASLGAISYSLYLVHIPVGGRVVNFGKRYLDSVPGHLMLSAAAAFASIAAAYCLYRLVEKPAQAWAGRIGFTRPGVPHDNNPVSNVR